MIRPALQLIAGIVLLALAATALFAHPFAGASSIAKVERADTLPAAITIDGIESMPMLSVQKR